MAASPTRRLSHAEGVDGALGPVPAKLHPIFRDRTDMSGGGQLSERIEEALKESERLIVLCSPASAVSPWANREVQTFIALGRTEHIFPVIATGLPDTDDVERDYFPSALRGLGLLAADLREIKQANGKLVGDGRDGGRLKLLAGVLGVGLDQLAQRERRRQRLLVAGLASAAIVLAAVALAAGWLATLTAQNNNTIRDQRDRAETLRYMATQDNERANRATFGFARESIDLVDVLANEMLGKQSPLPAEDQDHLLALALHMQNSAFEGDIQSSTLSGQRARSLFSAGRVLLELQRPDSAVSAFDAAAAIYSDLRHAEPQNNEYQSMLVMTWSDKAIAEVQLGQDARPTLISAVDVASNFEPAAELGDRHLQALSFAELGKALSLAADGRSATYFRSAVDQLCTLAAEDVSNRESHLAAAQGMAWYSGLSGC